jgi:hypothetical protein
MSRNDELKKLQKEWYAKLKKAGFDDIEYEDGSLRSAAPRSPMQKDPLIREAIQEYYYMANQFLHTHTFESKREQIIWEYHANGIGSADIVKVLKKVRIKLHESRVRAIIVKLRKIMQHEHLMTYEGMQ